MNVGSEKGNVISNILVKIRRRLLMMGISENIEAIEWRVTHSIHKINVVRI